MEKSRFDRAVDYFPLLSYVLFWLQGAVIASLFTGEPKLFAMGFVTLPAVAALIAAAIKIRKSQAEGNMEV